MMMLTEEQYKNLRDKLLEFALRVLDGKANSPAELEALPGILHLLFDQS